MILRLALALIFVAPLQAVWLTDLAEGKQKAAKEKKDLYLVFTSLEVSGACAQFKKRVLDQEGFQDAVTDRFVLVHLDIPLEDQPEQVTPVMGPLFTAQIYGVEAYPTAFLMNPDGQTYDRKMGGVIGSPQDYAAQLLKNSAEQTARVSALREAYQKEGLERAKAIVEVIKNAPAASDPKLYARHMDELAKADPEDSLGFRKRRLAEQGFQELDQALKAVFHKDSYDEVVKLVDGYVEKFEPTGELKQKALFPKLAALNHGNQIPEAIKAAEDVIAVDANSSFGKFAAQILKSLQSR